MRPVIYRGKLIIGLVILLAAVFTAPNQTCAITIYVDDDNTSGPWNGTVEHPYQHIQDGISHASASDTIYVFGGAYDENVTLDKKAILIGEDKLNTTIDGSIGGAGISVSADSVNIEGFTIERDGPVLFFSGVYVTGNHNQISGNIIQDCEHGVWLVGFTALNIVSENSINHNGVGILLEQSSNNFITGNVIRDNDRYGIQLDNYSTGNDIIANTIANNGQAGIILAASNNNTISADTITHNRNGILIGTSMSTATSNIISGNIVADNDLYGIRLQGGAAYPCTPKNNTVSGNAMSNNGISLWGTCNDTIRGNSFTSNGITMEGWELNQWNTQVMEDNTLNGIPIRFYRNTSGVTVPSNTAQLILANCTDFSIQNLQIKEIERGLQLGYSSANNISGAKITNNSYGIYMLASSNNTVYENSICDNTYGVFMNSSSGNTAYHNNFSNIHNAYDPDDNNWHSSTLNQGNYWSDYEGSDLDGNGIGDSPYHVPGGNGQDEYPLMYLWNNSVFVDDDADPSWYDATHLHTIQEGMDSTGNTGGIYVYNGAYHEHVTIDKKVDLVGQNFDSVIVDGSGGGDVFSLFADSVRIRGFKFQNSGAGAGIKVHSKHSTIHANNITNNASGIWVEELSDSNIIYHNNFVNNTQNAYDERSNTWDDGYPSGGNYWSDFDEPGEGAFDNNGDGLVDSPYQVPGGANQDKYPYINPWNGSQTQVKCGDANGDGIVDIGDVVFLINYLFKTGPTPVPAICVGDVNGDSIVNVGDIVHLLGYLFKNGPVPNPHCCN